MGISPVGEHGVGYSAGREDPTFENQIGCALNFLKSTMWRNKNIVGYVARRQSQPECSAACNCNDVAQTGWHRAYEPIAAPLYYRAVLLERHAAIFISRNRHDVGHTSRDRCPVWFAW